MMSHFTRPAALLWALVPGLFLLAYALTALIPYQSADDEGLSFAIALWGDFLFYGYQGLGIVATALALYALHHQRLPRWQKVIFAVCAIAFIMLAACMSAIPALLTKAGMWTTLGGRLLSASQTESLAYAHIAAALYSLPVAIALAVITLVAYSQARRPGPSLAD